MAKTELLSDCLIYHPVTVAVLLHAGTGELKI